MFIGAVFVPDQVALKEGTGSRCCLCKELFGSFPWSEVAIPVEEVVFEQETIALAVRICSEYLAVRRIAIDDDTELTD